MGAEVKGLGEGRGWGEVKRREALRSVLSARQIPGGLCGRGEEGA